MLLTYGIVPTHAVVCYAADRNELRSRVIQWLQTEIVPDGWFVKGSNFSDILLKYFKVGFLSLSDHGLYTILFYRITHVMYVWESPPTTLSFLRLCLIIRVTDISKLMVLIHLNEEEDPCHSMG